MYLSQCDSLHGCGKTFPSDLGKCPHCGNPQEFSNPAPLDVRDWGYDIETYPNIITATWIHAETGLCIAHEISARRDDGAALIEFMHSLGRSGARGVGFNNLGFDYPVLHWIAMNPGATVAEIYAYAMKVIKSENKFEHIIYDRDQIFQQLDLYKIWHFDNKAKSTSLKALEIAMRSRNVVDLPSPVGTHLTHDQMDVLLAYNKHDVRETLKFYARSLAEIHLREQLSEKYGRNMLNFSNTKIGGTILISQMEEAGIQCYERDANGRNQPRQTIRESINLGGVLFPYIKLEHPAFREVVDKFHAKTLRRGELDDELRTKGAFAGITATINDFTYVFGLGGIHGSVESQIIRSDDEFVIIDADVTSFYPQMAIVNGLYPAHLGIEYCAIYQSIFEQRAGHKKGTPENAALKEALNASFGNSNNEFSPLRDVWYTMATTINGQLSLCMLAEQLIKIPRLTMIQANTDGLTVRCPRQYEAHFYDVCKWWEGVTKLQLEYAVYSMMTIKDVNNYLAVSDGGGKVKRKGAYAYSPAWHQDPSALVVPRAAEAALVRGESIRDFIVNHRDPFDFMCRGKVPRASSLVMRWADLGFDQQIQNTTRYFIARNGASLVKISPPSGVPGTWKRKAKVTDEAFAAAMREITGQPGDLDAAGTPWDARIHTGNRSVHADRELSVCSGWKVLECADVRDFDWSQVNYEWYIQEAEKLVTPLLPA